MATGRTVSKWLRAYINGYDLSGQARSVGNLSIEHEEGDCTPLESLINSTRPGRASINMGNLNSCLVTTATTGIHSVLGTTGGVIRSVMIPIGIRAAPASGDPVWFGQFLQRDYKVDPNDVVVYTNVQFGEYHNQADSLAYEKAWGHLLHAKAAEVAANTSDSYDIDGGAQSTNGGLFMYQVFSGDGTATLSVEDSSDDITYAALTNATSGEIDCSSRQHGIVALSTTATVERYLQWQISLNTATTVTFAAAFIRG